MICLLLTERLKSTQSQELSDLGNHVSGCDGRGGSPYTSIYSYVYVALLSRAAASSSVIDYDSASSVLMVCCTSGHIVLSMIKIFYLVYEGDFPCRVNILRALKGDRYLIQRVVFSRSSFLQTQ